MATGEEIRALWERIDAMRDRQEDMVSKIDSLISALGERCVSRGKALDDAFKVLESHEKRLNNLETNQKVMIIKVSFISSSLTAAAILGGEHLIKLWVG